ncbi:MAG: lasso peptide biosynthesis protein [Fimbriimonadaceae bacterium]|nr:lasso peptide biosynthesis protein [Fimbriimonadaceae bacterium]QYK56935.1 MAG: lasso peptide biosynthesis protein [Fimbriimonadaceae bacterium]
MSRIWSAIVLVAFAALSWAGEEWLGVYLNNKKIGYASHISRPEGSGKVTESTEVIDGRLLGAQLAMTVVTKTWQDGSGRITRMQSKTESGGRVQHVDAEFGEKEIVATTSNGETTSKKTIPIPSGARLVEDPMAPLLQNGFVGSTTVHVFDPNTLTLLETKVRVAGHEALQTEAGEVQATVVRVEDPRAPLTVYLSPKGDFIKAVGPFGMELRPETREHALAGLGNDVDIATASSIVPDRSIDGYLSATRVKVRVTGVDLANLPSDAHQTVTKDGDGWIVEVHPVKPGEGPKSEESPAKWLSEDTYVPVGNATFRSLAHETARADGSKWVVAESLRKMVHNRVEANAGISVLRDATEIWSSGEGVCRDHAIVLATILRSNGIPARLVSGLVYGAGAFYYHAWVEALIENRWIGLDSTRSRSLIDATHIKVREGTVGEAFTSFLLDGAKIQVLEVQAQGDEK